MKKKTKQNEIEPGETEIEHIEVEKIKEKNMINNKYLIIAALGLSSPFIVAWTFNHISPWAAIVIVVIIFLVFNQYFKNKQK